MFTVTKAPLCSSRRCRRRATHERGRKALCALCFQWLNDFLGVERVSRKRNYDEAQTDTGTETATEDGRTEDETDDLGGETEEAMAEIESETEADPADAEAAAAAVIPVTPYPLADEKVLNLRK